MKQKVTKLIVYNETIESEHIDSCDILANISMRRQPETSTFPLSGFLISMFFYIKITTSNMIYNLNEFLIFKHFLKRYGWYFYKCYIYYFFIYCFKYTLSFKLIFFFVKLFYLRSMEHYHKLRAPKFIYDFNSDKLKSENLLNVDV